MLISITILQVRKTYFQLLDSYHIIRCPLRLTLLPFPRPTTLSSFDHILISLGSFIVKPV